MPRGSRGAKRGRLQWKKSAATRGRKGGMGRRKKFATWKENAATLRRTRTVIVVPPKAEEAPAQSDE